MHIFFLILCAARKSLACLCRSDNSDRSAWASLPLHLMDTVLRKLQSDVPSILRIRLVCKAWRAACASFPGPARITMSRGYDIFGVSKTLPGLRELHMSIDETRIYLPPLSALSRLTFLSTEYEESANLPQYGRDPLFDLIILPSGLRALELHCCHVDSESFTHMRCTALTRLLFRWTDNQPWEVEDLLRHLPLLQVNHPHNSSYLISFLTATRPRPELLPASRLSQPYLLPGSRFGTYLQDATQPRQ